MKWRGAVIWLLTPALLIFVALFVLLFYVNLGKQTPVAVSLVRLISNPEEFDGKTIMTEGLLRLSRNSYSARLYINKDDADNGISYNSIIVSISELVNKHDIENKKYLLLKKYDGEYVVILGVFRNTIFPVEKSEMHMLNLDLVEISPCRLQGKQEYCGPLILLPEKRSRGGLQPETLSESS